MTIPNAKPSTKPINSNNILYPFSNKAVTQPTRSPAVSNAFFNKPPRQNESTSHPLAPSTPSQSMQIEP